MKAPQRFPVLPKTAIRFAETSLALYAQEGTFATGVDDEQELETVAEAFERLGCTVVREPLRYRVQVTVPRHEG